MPLSSLNDPVDLARAQAALEQAWQQLKDANLAHSEEDRNRLAHTIATLTPLVLDEKELTRRAVDKFKTSLR